VLCTKDRTAMVVVEHVSRERSFQFLTVLVKHWCLLLLFLFVLVFLGVGFWVLVCSILFKSCLLFFGGFGIALRDIGSTFTVSNSIIRATSLLVYEFKRNWIACELLEGLGNFGDFLQINLLFGTFLLFERMLE